MREKKKKTENQSGRSMIEMLGVLAIIGVLSVGGLAGYNMAMRRVRLNRFIEELQLTAADQAEKYALSSNYVGTAPDMKELKEALSLVEAEAMIDFNMSDAETLMFDYSFKFTNASRKLCIKIAMTQWGQGVIVDNGNYPRYQTGNSEAAAVCSQENGNNFFLTFGWRSSKTGAK